MNPNQSRSFRPSLFTRSVALAAVVWLAAVPAQAAFHLWSLAEVYTDATGTLQFVEFSTANNNQQVLNGQQVHSLNIGGSIDNLFTLLINLPSSATGGKRFLLGTAGIQAAGGPAPDYIIPNNFLFSAGGTINFFGVNSGPYTALPTDGVNSRTWTGGNAVNSPQNFAGQTGVVSVPEPAVMGLVALGGLAIGLALRRNKR